MKLSNDVLETLVIKAAISGPTTDFNENLLIIRNGILATEVLHAFEEEDSNYVMISREDVEDILRLCEVRQVEARTGTQNNSDPVEFDEGYME